MANGDIPSTHQPDYPTWIDWNLVGRLQARIDLLEAILDRITDGDWSQQEREMAEYLRTRNMLVDAQVPLDLADGQKTDRWSRFKS